MFSVFSRFLEKMRYKSFVIALSLWASIFSILYGEAERHERDGLIASSEPGWPQWRGPRRDGISEESGLLRRWPSQGPELLWTASGLGRGYSSPIISRGTIYVTGDVGEELCVFALDLQGKLKWRTRNGRSWRGPYPGARASCAYSAGRIYHMNAHGRVTCLDAATGAEIWAVDVLERFGGRNIEWGLSESLLVDVEKVIVTPGGTKAYMAALDVKTGNTVWASQPLGEPAAYASPILFRFGGKRLLVNLAQRSLVCVDADSGRVHFTFPRPTQYDSNCATPVYCDGIFHTSPSGAGGVMLRLFLNGDMVRARSAWECRMDNVNGGAVAFNGLICGSGEYNTGWVCMDAKTGKEICESRELAQGSVIFADGHLYCLSEKGVVALVKVSDKFEIVSRFRLPGVQGGDAWAHPVICDGRLYFRYHDRLYCYDVRQSPQAAGNREDLPDSKKRETKNVPR